jgi:peptidoglycan/LPS O-acetylase OafA/YrhL
VDLNRLAWIDYGRGLAVLGVIAVHLGQKVSLPEPFNAFAEFGQTGVQLFFVLSAYSLALSMDRKPGSTTGFYIRRFFRIAPMYYVGILIYGVIAVAEHLGAAYTPLAVGENLLFVHGLDPNHFNNVVPGGWSIATEVGFYAIFPALILLANKMSNQALIASFVALTVLVAGVEIAAISVAQSFGMQLANDQFGFVYASLGNQLPVFSLGILLYRFRDRPFRNTEIGISVLCLGVSLFIMVDRTLDTGLDALFYSVLAGLGFLFAARFLMTHSNRWRRIKLLTSIGQASYSMYLLHFLALAAVYRFRAVVGLAGSLGTVDYLTTFLVAVTITYLMARLTVRFIENPGIRFGKRVEARLKLA